MNQEPNRQNQPPQPGQNPSFQQPCPGQYPQYPGQPGFPRRPRLPAWVIVLIVVAAAGVLVSAVLGGVLIGSRISDGPDRQPAEIVSSLESRTEFQPAFTAPPEESAPAAEAGPGTMKPASKAPAGSWTVGECLDEAIDWIEDFPTFVENYEYEPLGCLDDFDGDGCLDFLAVYQCQARNGTRYVGYCVYTFREDGPVLRVDGVLYQEVGGSGGSAGIAKGKDGAVYFTRFTREPDGSGPHNFYEYIPWEDLGVTEDNIYRMESQWPVEAPEQGTYLLGTQQTDRDAFEASRNNYTDWYSLDIVMGHGNGETNGAGFDTLEQWCGD